MLWVAIVLFKVPLNSRLWAFFHILLCAFLQSYWGRKVSQATVQVLKRKKQKECPKYQVTWVMFGRKHAGAEHFSHIFVENLGVAKNLSLDRVCNLSIILIHARNCPPGPHLSSCFYLNNPRNSGFFRLCSLQVSKAIRICFDSSAHLTLSNPSWLVVPSPFHIMLEMSLWLSSASIPAWFSSHLFCLSGWCPAPACLFFTSLCIFSLFFIQWEKTHYQRKYIC